MKKLASAFAALVTFIGLPLSARPQLLWHPCIILIMVAIIVVWMTQPAVTKEDALKNQSNDQNSVWLILALSSVSIVAPIVEWAYFDLGFRRTDFEVCQGVGLMSIIGGVALRLWAIRTLGDFFTATVQVQKHLRVITSGPYTWIRHPSYLGAYLAFMGCATLLEAWAALAVAMVCMGVAYHFRIEAEEKTLVHAFGKEYRIYQNHSWRLIPCIW